VKIYQKILTQEHLVEINGTKVQIGSGRGDGTRVSHIISIKYSVVFLVHLKKNIPSYMKSTKYSAYLIPIMIYFKKKIAALRRDFL
jgi:hypothetical protein